MTGRAADRVVRATRILSIGIGGGGDVVGALALAEAARPHGAAARVGGLSWERRVLDPIPGPRRLDEISGAEPLNECVALAGAETSGPGGFLFCEARMAAFLGEPVVLVDPNPGPGAIGPALDDAARRLECDLVALVDVGGDVLAHGDEPGLASPLADAVMLAAAAHMRTPVVGVVFGAGCDGELTPAEVLARVAEVGDTADVPTANLDRVRAATETVLTEASAMALRCALGETGSAAIRRGRRTVHLTPDGGRLICFDPAMALETAARLAAAVVGAADLNEAHAILTARGVRTELELEREAARG